jgi:hypothetical protein
VCYSSILTFIPLVQCTHSPFNMPCKCYSLVWCISELTYHIFPNTGQEFFLNLTHLKNWGCLLTVLEVKHTLFVHVMKTNLMHCSSSVYFVSQPLHVSAIYVAIIRRYTVYIQQLVRIVLFSCCLLSELGWNSQLKSTICTNCCTWVDPKFSGLVPPSTQQLW